MRRVPGLQPAGEGVAGVCGRKLARLSPLSLRGALATKQSRAPRGKILDCFAALAMTSSWRERSLPKILVPQLDRLAVRRPVRRVVPGIAIAMQRVHRRNALACDEALKRCEPV